MMAGNSDAEQVIGLMLRVGKTGLNFFKLLKNAMEMNLAGQGGEISLNKLKKFTNANINEFELTEKSNEELEILKNCLKEFGVCYNIKKSPSLNADGTRDFFIYFGAEDATLINRAFKEYCKQMDARDEQGLDGVTKKAKKQAEKENNKNRNKDKDLSKGKEQKNRNKNREMNFDI